MSSGFVLRDRAGHPAGYVMQGRGVVSCRACQLAQPAQLVLMRGNEEESRPMPADGREQTWPDGGEPLTGAYIAADGVLLLDTGEAARLAFERASRRAAGASAARARHQEMIGRAEKSAAEQETAQAPKETIPASTGAAQPSTEAARQTASPQMRSLPQRRWPPPPCWPEARYADGHWQAPEHHESG